MTSVCPSMMGGPSLRLFSLILAWQALARWRAFLASCWFFIIREAMSSVEGTAVGRTLTLGRRFMVLPKIDSKGERLVESPGAALMAVWT